MMRKGCSDDHHIIPSMILELDFRIRVQPPVHVAPLVHHVTPIIHPIVSTTTTTGTFTGNSPVPPLRITIPDHGTSASTKIPSPYDLHGRPTSPTPFSV